MIFWPREFPCWLLENHEGQDEDIYARTEMDVGPARLRRMYRAVPHIRKAEIFLHGEEPAAFHAFFEETLDRGTNRFTAPFISREGGTRYYECEFVKPYDAEFVLLSEARRAWRLRCEFRLYGDGTLDPGDMQPAKLASEYGVRLRASARVQVTAVLSVEHSVALQAVAGGQPLAVEHGAALNMRVTPYNELPGVAFMVALAGSVAT